MSELDRPDGWATAKLGELCELIRGVSFSSAEKAESPRDDYVACLRTTNVQDEVEWDDLWFIPESRVKTEAQFVRPNDILISTANSRELVGKVARVISVDKRTTLGAFISAIRPIEGVEPKYLFSLLRSTQSRSAIGDTASTTTNISNLSMTRVLEIEFPVAPAPEQGRIAAKIDELFSDWAAGVATLKRARANLKRYRAAVLKAAVEGRLTEKWRAAHPKAEPAEKLLDRILKERRKKWEEAQLRKFAEKKQAPPKGWKNRYPEPVQPDVASLSELPKGWCWATLEMLAEIVGGITKGQKRDKGQALREVPYLRVANVQRGFLDLEKMKTIAATEKEIAELRLECGDVLFNEGGDRDKLGRGWVWEGAIEECIHQNHVFRARLTSRNLQPKFVSVHGNTFGKHWFQRTGKQSVNLASINMTILRAFPVPVAPGPEQRAIVDEIEAQLSVCDAVEKQLEVEAVRATPMATSNSPICGHFKFPQWRRQERVDCRSKSSGRTRRRTGGAGLSTAAPAAPHRHGRAPRWITRVLPEALEFGVPGFSWSADG